MFIDYIDNYIINYINLLSYSVEVDWGQVFRR
jgi:hypothetical protein